MDQISSSDDNLVIMVAISIGVLTFVFLCALLGLVYICRRQRLALQTQRWSRFDVGERNTGKGGRRTRRSTRRKTTTPTNSTTNTRSSEHELAFALNDIGLGSALEQILCDDQWMDDASGVIPHCLAILRTCHSLTERLAELASIRPIGNNKGTMSYDAAQATARLIEATKRVPSRVDDVVRSMHPPFDVRLLEARLAALVLAVSQVALLTQSVAIPPNNSVVISARGAAVGQWIDEALNDMHAHLLVLRHISEQQTADEQSGNSRVYTSCSEV